MSNDSSKATKQCPKCKEPIDATAKRCKHCQADLRNWFVRHKILTGILAFFVFIIIVAAASGGDDTTGSGSNKTSEEKTYKVNDAITTNSMEITVTSVEEKNKVGTEFFESSPAEGGTYVVVQWKYKNTSDTPLEAFSKPTLQLQDNKGTTYDADIGASANYATEIDLDTKVFSDLNPGITVNDASVFEVSKDSFNKNDWSVVVDMYGMDYTVKLQ